MTRKTQPHEQTTIRIPFAEGPPSEVPALGAGLPDRDPWGVPFCEDDNGWLSLSFLVFPPSLISPPEPAPPSTSLPEPAPPGPTFRIRFLPTWNSQQETWMVTLVATVLNSPATQMTERVTLDGNLAGLSAERTKHVSASFARNLFHWHLRDLESLFACGPPRWWPFSRHLCALYGRMAYSSL